MTEAFRYTAATGMVGLGFLRLVNQKDIGGAGLTSSSAVDLNYDGSVIVGGSSSYYALGDAFNTEPFRWTAATGMVGLGFLDGTRPNAAISSFANGVNRDGSVIVGTQSDQSGGINHAWRWTGSTGLNDLGTLAGLDRKRNLRE